VMGASAIFGMFAGVYHWFPRMFGRMINKKLGYIHFWLTVIAVYGVFFPMHFLGLAGVPRRYYTNTAYESFSALVNINELITYMAILGGIAQAVFAFNFFYSIFKGKKSTQNPWGSNTIEWTAPIKHLHGNWPGEIPTVYRWPYDYGKPGAAEDFIPQTVPYSQTRSSNLPGEED